MVFKVTEQLIEKLHFSYFNKFSFNTDSCCNLLFEPYRYSISNIKCNLYSYYFSNKPKGLKFHLQVYSVLLALLQQDSGRKGVHQSHPQADL